MNAINIVFFLTDIIVGKVFMWNEPGNNTFVVKAVHSDPDAGFAGKKLTPYATVRWSDSNADETINLADIVSYVRSGLLIPTD